MNSLRSFYQPKKILMPVYEAPPRVSSTNEFLHPVVAHRWGGNFPLNDFQKKVVLDLEPEPMVMFQHSPTFAYYPQHSNLDVNL